MLQVLPLFNLVHFMMGLSSSRVGLSKLLTFCAFLAILTFTTSFSPLHDIAPIKFISNKFFVRKHPATKLHTLETEVLTAPFKSSSELKKHDDERCTMFRPTPEIRKLMITYLYNRIAPLTDASGKVVCNRERIRAILSMIAPPLPAQTLDQETENILLKLEGEFIVEERDFIVRVLLDNDLWKEVGETVVKELVYVQNLEQLSTTGTGLISESCAEKLEQSLREDNSSVLKFSKEDALLACKLFKVMNEPHEAQLVTNAALPSRIPFFADVEKFEPYDACGNPTLLMLTAERLKNYTSPFAAASSQNDL